MKRMKTRLICNALAACLLLLVFAGCAAEETTVTEPPASAVPATESASMDTPAPEEPAATALPLVEETQTFTYFMAQANGFSNPLIGDASEAKYFEELEMRTNIHLDITVQPVSNASEIFSIMVAGDEVSDLIENASNYYSLTDLLADEIILDLTDLVESCMPNYQALLASNAEYAKTSTTDTGEMGMVYGYYEEGLKPEYGLVIRQDWLEELSLEQPRTYAEYHEVLTAFASEYGAGVYLQSNGFTMGNYLAAGFGVMGNSAIPPFPPFQQIDGTVYFGPAMEEMYDYIALMSQWYAEGLIDSDFMTNNNATPENTNREYQCG